MSARAVIVVGNPKAASRTRSVAESVAAHLDAAVSGGITSEVIELAELTGELFDWSSETVAAAVGQVKTADVLIVASPVYKATYTGLLKVFLDRFGAGELTGIVAVPLLVGAAPGHTLAVETHLRPLLVELGATCLTPGLFVQEQQIPELDDVLKPWVEAVAPVVRALLG